MKETLIHDLPGWRVWSYGNGLSYEVIKTGHPESLYFQGDDADQFRKRFDELTGGMPSLDFADALQVIWSEYLELV